MWTTSWTGLLDPEQIDDTIDFLSGTARQIALEGIQTAISEGASDATINQALQALAEGDDLRSSVSFSDTINAFTRALKLVVKGLG